MRSFSQQGSNNYTEELGHMDYSAKIAKIARQHQGAVTQRGDGNYLIQFTEQVRAEGCYDDLFCREWATATWDGAKAITVQV